MLLQSAAAALHQSESGLPGTTPANASAVVIGAEKRVQQGEAGEAGGSARASDVTMTLHHIATAALCLQVLPDLTLSLSALSCPDSRTLFHAALFSLSRPHYPPLPCACSRMCSVTSAWAPSSCSCTTSATCLWTWCASSAPSASPTQVGLI